MTSTMVKTSVTLPSEDLEAARRLGINISELTRASLRQRLHDEELDGQIKGYCAAFAEWDEQTWDHLAAEGSEVSE